ncbi:MAG: hypothetical protein HUU08_12615 [Candidatus Brocadia sp.]|nr:hypothetical protein [Candidatus Brocadia sp.]
MKPIIFDNEPIIYTIGAFLKPLQVTDSEGREIWVWYVSEFDEGSFKDGKPYNPKEFANSKKELLASIE